MTPLFALLLLQTPINDFKAQLRYEQCAKAAKEDPEKGVADAEAWRAANGGLPASQCLGLAFVALERWLPAAIAFEQAAKDAELVRDGRAATLWVQSGNAALAADDPARARSAFDRALALPVLQGTARGEALLDRARAHVAINDLASARTDMDQALVLAPNDATVWLLSAALARRQGDAARAGKDLSEATRLGGDADEIAAERERIAALAAPSAPAQQQLSPAKPQPTFVR